MLDLWNHTLWHIGSGPRRGIRVLGACGGPPSLHAQEPQQRSNLGPVTEIHPPPGGHPRRLSQSQAGIRDLTKKLAILLISTNGDHWENAGNRHAQGDARRSPPTCRAWTPGGTSTHPPSRARGKLKARPGDCHCPVLAGAASTSMPVIVLRLLLALQGLLTVAAARLYPHPPPPPLPGPPTPSPSVRDAEVLPYASLSSLGFHWHSGLQDNVGSPGHRLGEVKIAKHSDQQTILNLTDFSVVADVRPAYPGSGQRLMVPSVTGSGRWEWLPPNLVTPRVAKSLRLVGVYIFGE